jgi:polyisoprenyl-teichoic acid--peptidoglycan teichoic acid transferase
LYDVPKAPGIWKRLVLGALLVIVASASATAVAAFREVDRVVNAFKEGEALELGGELAEADTGKPQTIMLIGSDKRAKTARDAAIGAAERPRSDTIILVRLDPGKGATALMSLPRDLRVQIPGRGTAKINEAFSLGGPRLALRTVKRLTGLTINHVINVNFGGFREAVNEIGCVYMDIDRRYFNENRGGASNFAAIDVQQGYRRLCGEKALQYVRYRHTDNDLVRGARQQEFLRQAKAQVGVRKLFDDRDKLAKIFGRYTDSDIDGRKAVLRLIKLAIASAGQPIREVHFEGRITTGDAERGVPSYVIASQPAVRKLTQQFLGVEDTKGPRGKTRSRKKRRRSNGSDTAGLEDARDAGRQQAVQAIGGGVKFTPYYPRMRPRGSQFQDKPLVYGIRDPEGKVHNAYRIVIRHSHLGEYSGLQGTTWKSPPILDDPSETRRIRGRKYELHYDGDRLRLVAWRTDEAVYWISNTLLQSLTERQMLAMARSARSL